VGTTRGELSIKILRELFVSLPTSEEQDEVVRRLASIEEDLTTSVALLEKAKSLKTGVMKDLLSGSVRVADLLKESA
jgi:type I restriction enzyme, S subunit